MNIIFIHQNLLAQYEHLIDRLSQDSSNNLVGICRDYAPAVKTNNHPKIRLLVYKPIREPTKNIHRYVYNIESSVLNGQAVAKVLHELKREGFSPDLCFAHIGWGEALYFKDIFPGVPLIAYCEFYYHAKGVDADFDPEFPITTDDELRIRTRNAVTLLSLVCSDRGVSPIEWQKQLFPIEFQNKISVIHDGIDTSLITPDILATFTLPDGTQLDCKDEIVTFTVRNLEPYRGFHIFMRAVEEVCKRRPFCHILITGGDGVSYGARLKSNETYREKMLREVEIDSDRVHFLGEISYSTHRKILQISSIHVYLTVPFVLSWSALEAMSAGCVVIGSDTPPVKEVIQHNKNGLLVNFFSYQHIADLIDQVFNHPNRMQHLRDQARIDVVKRFDINLTLAMYEQLINDILKRA